MLDKSSKVTNCMHFKGEFLGLHDTSGFPNYRTSLQGTRICDNRGGKLKGTQKIMENIYAKEEIREALFSFNLQDQTVADPALRCFYPAIDLFPRESKDV